MVQLVALYVRMRFQVLLNLLTELTLAPSLNYSPSYNFLYFQAGLRVRVRLWTLGRSN